MTQTDFIVCGVYILFLIINTIAYVFKAKTLYSTNTELTDKLTKSRQDYINKQDEYKIVVAELQKKSSECTRLTNLNFEQMKELDLLRAELDKFAPFITPFLLWLAEKVEKVEGEKMEGKPQKGDRVIVTEDCVYGDFYKKGWIGTCKDNSDSPFIEFDNGKTSSVSVDRLLKIAPAQLSFADLWHSYTENYGDRDIGMDSRTFGLLLHQKGIKSKKVKGKGTMYQGVKWRVE